MCIITASTLATVTAVAGAAGAGISALGAIKQGEATSAQASYEAQVANNNAVVAEQNSQYATKAGEARSFAQGLAERQKAGAVTAGLAASGLDINSGSAADVRASQAEIGETDVETTRQQAALQAYGYRTQSSNFGAQAQLDTAQAGYDTTAGWLKGLGGLLGSAKSLPTKWFGSTSGTDFTGGNYQDTGGAVV